MFSVTKTMRHKLFLLSVLSFLLFSQSVFSQEKPKILVNADGSPNVSPEDELFITGRNEILKNLDLYALFSARVSISNVPQQTNTIQIKKSNLDKMKFELFIENTSQTIFDIAFTDGSAAIRPELKLNGKQIKYSRDKSDVLKSKEVIVDSFRMKRITLEPSIKKSIPEFAGIGNLQKWYDPLETGHYELTLHYYFSKDQNGNPKKLSTQTFFLEVLPD